MNNYMEGGRVRGGGKERERERERERGSSSEVQGSRLKMLFDKLRPIVFKGSTP